VSVPSGDKVAASDTAANVPGLLNAAQITALPAIGVSLVRLSSASDLALTVAHVAALDVKVGRSIQSGQHVVLLDTTATSATLTT
jgi:hypothetical protein